MKYPSVLIVQCAHEAGKAAEKQSRMQGETFVWYCHPPHCSVLCSGRMSFLCRVHSIDDVKDIHVHTRAVLYPHGTPSPGCTTRNSQQTLPQTPCWFISCSTALLFGCSSFGLCVYVCEWMYEWVKNNIKEGDPHGSKAPLVTRGATKISSTYSDCAVLSGGRPGRVWGPCLGQTSGGVGLK